MQVLAEDSQAIEQLQLLSPRCALLSEELAELEVDSELGSEANLSSRLLELRFALGSLPKDKSLKLFIQSSDGVNGLKTSEHVVEFEFPELVASQTRSFLLTPKESEILAGNQEVRLALCSHEDLELQNIEIQNLAANSWNLLSSDKNQETDYYELVFNLDTALLASDEHQLQIAWQARQQHLQMHQANIQVDNDRQIEIKAPRNNRTWLRAQETLRFVLDPSVEADSVHAYLERGPNDLVWRETDSKVNSVDVSLDVSSFEEGTLIGFYIEATRAGQTVAERFVYFEVRNKPQIQDFRIGAQKYLPHWEHEIQFKVLNVEPTEIYLDNKRIEAKDLNCQLLADNIKECSVQINYIPSGQNLNLKAHGVRSSSERHSSLQTSYQLTLAESSNQRNLSSFVLNLYDEPGRPADRLSFVDDFPNYYRLLIDGAVYRDFISGEELDFADLNPLTDYQFKLEKFSDEARTIRLSSWYKNVTTNDRGLMGWWRLEQDLNQHSCNPQDLQNDPRETICDYSGKNNHARVMRINLPDQTPHYDRQPEWRDSEGHRVLYFDGVDDCLEVDAARSLDFKGEQTIIGHFNLEAAGGFGKDRPVVSTLDIENPNNEDNLGYWFGYGWGSEHIYVVDWTRYPDSISIEGEILYQQWSHNVSAFDSINMSFIFEGEIRQEVLAYSGNSSREEFVIRQNPQNLWIGCSTRFSSYFIGMMREVMIYDRSLSAEEIRQSYNRVQ